MHRQGTRPSAEMPNVDFEAKNKKAWCLGTTKPSSKCFTMTRVVLIVLGSNLSYLQVSRQSQGGLTKYCIGDFLTKKNKTCGSVKEFFEVCESVCE